MNWIFALLLILFFCDCRVKSKEQKKCKDACDEENFIPINGRCYHFSRYQTKWEVAEQKCGSMFPGSILAQFETPEETASVLDYLTRQGNFSFYWWLGGNDFAARHDFRWVVGKRSIDEVDWCQNEPDPQYVHRCVHIDIYDNKFCLGNFKCEEARFESRPFRYICEMPTMSC